jgi:hypothetical protein
MDGLGGWHIKRRDGVEGPLIGFELAQRARDGRLNRDDLLSETESGPWVEAGKLEQFFPATDENSEETGDVTDQESSVPDAGTEPSTTKSPGVATRYKNKRQRERRTALVTFLFFGGFIAFKIISALLRSQDHNR